jgi:hypothetical protein
MHTAYIQNCGSFYVIIIIPNYRGQFRTLCFYIVIHIYDVGLM